MLVEEAVPSGLPRALKLQPQLEYSSVEYSWHSTPPTHSVLFNQITFQGFLLGSLQAVFIFHILWHHVMLSVRWFHLSLATSQNSSEQYFNLPFSLIVAQNSSWASFTL